MNALFKPTHIHSKLDGSWLYLHEQMPPQKWAALPSFGTAATWLGMHHSLRRGQGELDYLSREYQQGRLRWPDYRSRLLHTAELHYGHLHGHHRLEDTHHFPQMRKLEPKLARGFDVLDALCLSIGRNPFFYLGHQHIFVMAAVKYLYHTFWRCFPVYAP